MMNTLSAEGVTSENLPTFQELVKAIEAYHARLCETQKSELAAYREHIAGLEALIELNEMSLDGFHEAAVANGQSVAEWMVSTCQRALAQTTSVNVTVDAYALLASMAHARHQSVDMLGEGIVSELITEAHLTGHL